MDCVRAPVRADGCRPYRPSDRGIDAAAAENRVGLSDTQLGGLVSIVAIAVALGVVPLSLLADRYVKSIFLMALIWSLATVACAFSGSYAQLLAARGVVGLGEAAYGTAGAALIASLFPARVRSTMLGAFLAAAVVGSVLGVMLGGIIAERWGWQLRHRRRRRTRPDPGAAFFCVCARVRHCGGNRECGPRRNRWRRRAAAVSPARRSRYLHRRRIAIAGGFGNVCVAAKLFQSLRRAARRSGRSPYRARSS